MLMRKTDLEAIGGFNVSRSPCGRSFHRKKIREHDQRVVISNYLINNVINTEASASSSTAMCDGEK